MAHCGVGVWDSKVGDASPVLRFTRAEVAAWLAGTQTGEFDDLGDVAGGRSNPGSPMGRVRRMALTLSTSQLRDYAEDAIDYEVGTLLDQVGRLQSGVQDVVLRRALLEAGLVHLRILDDFFAKVPHPTKDDVTAKHYLSGWTAGSFLSHADRGQLNAQLMHLALRRQNAYQWSAGKLMIDACDTYVRFVNDLRQAAPARAQWFAAAYQRAAAVTPAPRRITYLGMPSTNTSSSTMVTSSVNPLSGSTTIGRQSAPGRRRWGPIGRLLQWWRSSR